MSASSTPTFNPRSRNPRARLTAVVDLPTPPFPDATAMIASTPGTAGCCPAGARPCGRAPGGGAADGRAAGGAVGGRAPVERSPVSATIAETTPGTARTAASAALRTGSQAGTSAASTVIEKNTLPSVTITSDSLPVAGSGLPSGLLTAASAVRTVVLSTAVQISGSASGLI